MRVGNRNLVRVKRGSDGNGDFSNSITPDKTEESNSTGFPRNVINVKCVSRCLNHGVLFSCPYDQPAM